MQKYVNLVDLVKSFPTSIYLQKSASIQLRTSLSKFGGKFNSLFIRLLSPDAHACWTRQDGSGELTREHEDRSRFCCYQLIQRKDRGCTSWTDFLKSNVECFRQTSNNCRALLNIAFRNLILIEDLRKICKHACII